MNPIINLLQQWKLHPVADHFTIALLMVGVLMDLLGSTMARFRWMRYMALTLMIFGAISAAISWETGGWEAHKVHDLLNVDTKALLHHHAELGDWLLWVFLALATWRVLIEYVGFFSLWRGIYLIAAIIAVILLGYQGYMGGQLVYGHGVGTALLTASPTATLSPVQAAPTSLPTVYVPASATATPSAPGAEASPSAIPSETPSPAAGAATPSATPTA
ncbi:MAG: DUF2231 domain-containing protein [Candidatus Binataceae bacterium]|nr:DUF2231 domain-containing protein [Candidatus Binataceae bacterium]